MREFDELQSHVLQRSLVQAGSAKDLMRTVRNQLLEASDRTKLSTPPQDVYGLVGLSDEFTPTLRKALQCARVALGAFVVTGGEKNRGRSKDLRHFKRSDGAWFDFSIVGRGYSGFVEILAYTYEIRLPVGHGAPFVRFDLNVPDGANQEGELRCHVHIGSDDVRIPAPTMTPREMLALFIDGICAASNRDGRTRTAFEHQWFAESHRMLAGDSGVDGLRERS
ncbi:MAG: hypothetical protein JW940_25230 [Polyangiaceae bacterium]|nr:hypothetical protein [Polyangiaceae bacterium]